MRADGREVAYDRKGASDASISYTPTEDGEFTVAMAEHCGCGEVERFVALLQALDHYSIAAALLEHHIEFDQCEPSSHPEAAAVFAAA